MADSNSGLVDFSDTIGCFVILSQKGQLFALNGIAISSDFSKLAPRINSASFHAVYPLVARVKPSNIVLVIHPGERGQAYFLMDIKTGPLKKSVKVFLETVEIISNALADDVFPIIHLGELQKAALQSRKNQTPISIPIRYLELRQPLPPTWGASVKDLFLANAETKSSDKTSALENKLETVREEVRVSMFENYLEKCLWYDAGADCLGSLKLTEPSVEFSRFSPTDPRTTSFCQLLARSPDGRFETRREFANVIPTLVKQHQWTSPTLHVYDEEFRDKNQLDEYYSLYKGLKSLCKIGAPVLVYEGGPLGAVIPVVLLRPSIGSGDIAQLSVKEFPTKAVVWATTEL